MQSKTDLEITIPIEHLNVLNSICSKICQNIVNEFEIFQNHPLTVESLAVKYSKNGEPKHAQVFHQILEVLVSEKLADSSGNVYDLSPAIRDELPRPSEEILKCAMTRQDSLVDFHLLSRIYDGLRQFLSHLIVPQEILFPNLDFTLMKSFYEKSHIGSYYNRLLLDYFKNKDKDTLGDILEIGTGTGSSLTFLQSLSGKIVSLTLSDYSKRLMRELKKSSEVQKWPNQESLNFQQLDLNALPEQSDAQYDHIFAVNTFHLAANPHESANRLRAMLKNQGTLILAEAFIAKEQPNYLLNLSFGLLPSLYQSNSIEIPLRTCVYWKQILEECGFQKIAILPTCESTQARFGGLIVAQR